MKRMKYRSKHHLINRIASLQANRGWSWEMIKSDIPRQWTLSSTELSEMIETLKTSSNGDLPDMLIPD